MGSGILVAALDDVRPVEDARQFAAQSFGGGHVDAGFIGPESYTVWRGHFFPFLVIDQFADCHGLELAEPAFGAETVDQGIEGSGSGIAQVEFSAEEFDILRQDFRFEEFEVKIRRFAADGAAAPQADDLNGRAELGLEARNGFAGIRRDVIIAVLIVHIQHEDGSLIAVDKPGQQDARQERFAGTGGAEDTGTALYEFIQIDAHRMILLAGAADLEIGRVVGRAEDFGHVAGRGQKGAGVVCRDGFDGQRPRIFRVFVAPVGVIRCVQFGTAFEHEGGQYFEVGEQGLTA